MSSQEHGASGVRIVVGDCIEVMAGMDEESVDAIVTDPPYGLGFMAKAWDALPPGREWAEQCLRVLKPGGHLLAFGGTRTSHRLVCAIEDAGFEIRDTIAWMYGSGFPKSLDVSKAIDRAAGAEREIVGVKASDRPNHHDIEPNGYGGGARVAALDTAPATPEAQVWEGWGTALKPAHEPVTVARKALAGTVAATVEQHGTGALNIDACRIAGDMTGANFGGRQESSIGYGGTDADGTYRTEEHPAGRWPANVVLDPEAAAMLDEQTGVSCSRVGKPRGAASGDGWVMTATGAEYNDEGGASRFFYVAKPDDAERNAGLGPVVSLFAPDDAPARNDHPTVKPIDLMRWLCRLVTPPGGTVLDPFTGSGTTGCAAALEGFDFIGIEREEAYARIARARIAHWGLEAAA